MEKNVEARVRGEQSQHQQQHGVEEVPQRSSIVFRAPQENFTIEDFELGRVYGVGSFSKVVRAKKKDTGNVCALKIMDKKFITKENKVAQVKMERIVLDQLDHPGIVRLYFTFQDMYYLYMALECCEGGELFDLITRRGRLSENEARFYTAEIVDAMEYLHGLGLVHQDIKPENLLLTADGHIKIADFGSVNPLKDCSIKVLPNASDGKGSTFAGTAAYVPPEVLKSSSTTIGNDLWALGCTLYQMLSGTSPFKDDTDWLIFERIAARDFIFPDYFSDGAIDLIDKLLDADPMQRLGAGLGGYAALKMHPFFKRINWENLRNDSLPETACSNASEENGSRDSSCTGDGSTNRHGNLDRCSGATSSSDAQSNISRVSSIDSFDSNWQQFLEPGEAVLMISKLKKVQKITNKKVQLILTDRAKLIYVDHSKVAKGRLLLSNSPSDLNVQVANASHFKICLPNKVMSFEDKTRRAWQWKKAVEVLQKR